MLPPLPPPFPPPFWPLSPPFSPLLLPVTVPLLAGFLVTLFASGLALFSMLMAWLFVRLRPAALLSAAILFVVLRSTPGRVPEGRAVGAAPAPAA